MASAADWRAIFSVWAALSALCLMVAAISSIEAEASSVEEACSVAPWLSCSAVADISWLPAETLLAEAMASAITSRSFSTMRCSAQAERVLVGQRLGLDGQVAIGDLVGERSRGAQVGGHDVDGVNQILDLVIGRDARSSGRDRPMATRDDGGFDRCGRH